MKTLRFKLTPVPAAAETVHCEVLFYSCPDIKGNPVKTLAHLQKVAAQRQTGFTYELTDDEQYFAVRGARVWLFTDPDDLMATKAIESTLVRGGVFDTCAEIIGIICPDTDNSRVQVITEKTCLTIHVRTGEITKQNHVPEGWERIEAGSTN